MFYTGVLRTLILSAFLLLAVKTVDMIILASVPDADSILVGESQAAAKPKADKKPAKSEHGESKEKEHAPAKEHGEEKPKAEGEAAPAEGEKAGEKTDSKANGEEKPAEGAEGDRPVSIDEVKTFSDAEIDVLKRLSERRERLAKWENDLQIKENVLKITEEKIDTKLEDLRKLKKEVEISLAEYHKQEDAKTLSLVKIYENMKPKNAADILSKMRVDDVLPIIDKMKQKNSAEILAKMDPKFAKEVTTKLNRIGQLKAQ